MRLVRRLHFVILLLPLISGIFPGTTARAQLAPNIGPSVLQPGPSPANGVYFDCEVVEHLHLTNGGYRSYPSPDPVLGGHLTIDRRSGEVSGRLFALEWERIRVVKTSPDYNVFMTRGYSRDGTPVNEVVLTKSPAEDVIRFVSIDLLTSLDILDGTCK